MERTLREKYGAKDDSDNFGSLINRYTDDYYNQNGREIYGNPYKLFLPKDKLDIYNSIKGIYKNHYLSNAVRHRFYPMSVEQAEATVACFLSFAKAEGWNNIIANKKLQDEIKVWKEHGKYQSPELIDAIEQIKKLKSENENLAQKANELNELQIQLNTITSREKVLKSELAEKELRLSKKDEKLDKIRKDANDKYMQYRKEKEEILKKMEDYEITKKYMDYLESVSFYTKTRHEYEKSIVSY